MWALFLLFLLLLPFSIHAEDLGELSANPYNHDSTSSPYGRYGSSYSPDSMRNPSGISLTFPP